ncbi:hypothetical protein [Pedobacter alluvionis]|nr:hypothetical protein [Pedobacter alluvionis]
MSNIRFYGVGYAGFTDRDYCKLKAMLEFPKLEVIQHKPENKND